MTTGKRIFSFTITTFLFLIIAAVADAGGMVPSRYLINSLASRPDKPKQQLAYYNGPVISHVKIVAVFWGPNVDGQVKSQIGDFYKTVTNSTYVDWLEEYNTKVPSGTNQDIGRGTFAGAVTIIPKNTASRLDKRDVEAELEFQIDAGTLPKPDADTLYMIHYPAGITLSTGGIDSCSAWCGDHEGFKSKNYGNIAYAMMPDLGGACAFGCGFAGTMFDSMTVIASHELVESITDPMCPDINAVPAFPAAWITTTDEIGDLCVNSSATLTSADHNYSLQGEFDNSQASCKGGSYTSP